MTFSHDDSGWVIRNALPTSLVYSSIKFVHNSTTFLVLNKLNYIELLRVDRDTKELLPELSVSVLGPVEHLHYIGDCKILLINRKAQYTILKFIKGDDAIEDKMDIDVESKEQSSAGFEKVRVLVRGSLEDESIRPIERGSLVAVDPLFRFFVWVGSQGVLRLVPLYLRGRELFFGQIHNLRLHELNVLDMAISLHSSLSDVIILTLLYQDSLTAYNLRNYHIDWASPAVFSDRHMTAEEIISVPYKTPQRLLVNSFTNEIFLFARDAVCVYPRQSSVKTAFIDYSGMCVASSDTVLCADLTGKLYSLSLTNENFRITTLGKIQSTTNMIYFEEGTVFCGGAPGFDNFIVSLSKEPSPKGDYISKISFFGNNSEVSSFIDGFGRGEIIAAIGSSEEPFTPMGKLSLIREGYACKLSDAVELDTGGAQLSKIFHVTISNNQYLVVGDPFGTRIVLDLENGYQPAQGVESGTLELIKGARGLRITSRGVLYSFSEKSVFIIAPKMELVYKAVNGNLIKNFDVYEDICVLHATRDLTIGPVGWAWRHTIQIAEVGEIAAFTISRCHGTLILAIVDWKNTLRIFSVTEANLAQHLNVKVEGLVAPRDVALLCGEVKDEVFVVVGDCRGIIHVYNTLLEQFSVIECGFRGPVKFEPFLDRIVLLGERPGIFSCSHGTVVLTPLNLPMINAFVDTGMGGFSAITLGSVLISGFIEIENPSGKHLTKVISDRITNFYFRFRWRMSFAKRFVQSGILLSESLPTQRMNSESFAFSLIMS